MPRLADFPQDGTKLVDFKLAGALLVLSEKELLALLALNPATWQAALQRGKAAKRREAAAGRQK